MSDSETSGSFMRSIAPILVVLGVGLYAYLSYIYQRFYTELDVTPSDVGFTYATTLARSMGLIVAALIAFIGVLVLRTLLGALLAFFEDPSAIIAIVPLAVVSWFALPFVLYAVTEPGREADIAARQVKVGLAVAPIRVLGLTVMEFRADSADVEVNGKPGTSPTADALAARTDLVYLGRTEGVVVFFDPARDQPIQVPANAVMIRLQRPPARNGRSPICVLTSMVREWWEKPFVGPMQKWRPRC